MTFKDQTWTDRFTKMGDEAEGKFEEVCDKGYVRYGLNRPPIRMSSLPARLRYTPDYLMSNMFVEVQGFGADQRLKIKLDKWGALRWWNDLHPVQMFVWDSTNLRYCYVTLAQLESLFGSTDCELACFPEGKQYFSLDGDAVFRLADHAQT